MQETKKKRIVIASVLKPVNDTRMYEKIARTLADDDSYEIHVIGFPANASDSKISLHSLSYFKRLSFQRLFAGIKIIKEVTNIRPTLLIVTTHELLLEAWICKMILKCKLIYDIQENYFRNILYTDAFPKLVRPFIATYVRIKEILTSPFIDHFLLAERMYQHEMSFFAKRFTVIENKAKKPVADFQRSGERFNLLFSGTLAESTGVFIAIDLFKSLHQIDKRYHLTIIGYCAQSLVLKKLRAIQSQHSFIDLISGEELVPHQSVINKIIACDAGIISYPDNPSTFNSVPTKLYEYLTYQLPIILIDHPRWRNLCDLYEAAIIFNPDQIDALKISQELQSKQFYPRPPESIFWEDEAKKLKNVIKEVS